MEKSEQLTANIVLPDCHMIKNKILTRFITVRLQIICKKMRDRRKREREAAHSGGELGSKSMAMRKMVKKVR